MTAPQETNQSIGIWGLFTWSWRLFCENFRLVFLITLAVTVPSNILFALAPTGAEVTTFMEHFRSMRLWQILLDATFGLVAVIMIIFLADASLQKEKLSFGELLRKSLLRYPLVLITSIMMGVSLLFATFCLVVPGIYFSIAWSFVIPAAVLSGMHGWAAMQKSVTLIQGRWWSTLGYYIALGFMFLVVGILSFLPEVGVIFAMIQGHLTPFTSYTDLANPGALVTFLIYLLAFLPLDLVVAWNIMLGVVMYRVWESSIIKK